MKKFFLFISIFLFTTNVSAYEIGVWTDEVIEDNNIVIKGSEIRYKWYQNITNVSPDYYVRNDNDSLYPNIYIADYVETSFTEWSEEVPVHIEERVIESNVFNRYRTLKPIRYIFFDNAIGGFINFRIAELNILIDDQPIIFELDCNDCNSTYKNDMKDGLYEDVGYINNGGNLRIDLGAYYGIEQIKIELYMYDTVPNTKKFDLYFNEGETLYDHNYGHKKIDIFTVSTDPSRPEKHLIIPDETFIETPVYSDWIYIDGYVNRTFYREMQTVPMYRYKDMKYRYYNIERSYLDGYYTQVEDNNYIKDEETAKTYYLYDYYVPCDNSPDETNVDDVDKNEVISNNEITNPERSNLKSNPKKETVIVTNHPRDPNQNNNKYKKIAITEKKDNIDNIEKNKLVDFENQNNTNDLNNRETDFYKIISQISLIILIITLCTSIYLVKKTSQILSYQK